MRTKRKEKLKWRENLTYFYTLDLSVSFVYQAACMYSLAIGLLPNTTEPR